MKLNPFYIFSNHIVCLPREKSRLLIDPPELIREVSRNGQITGEAPFKSNLTYPYWNMSESRIVKNPEEDANHSYLHGYWVLGALYFSFEDSILKISKEKIDISNSCIDGLRRKDEIPIKDVHVKIVRIPLADLVDIKSGEFIFTKTEFTNVKRPYRLMSMYLIFSFPEPVGDISRIGFSIRNDHSAHLNKINSLGEEISLPLAFAGYDLEFVSDVTE